MKYKQGTFRKLSSLNTKVLTCWVDSKIAKQGSYYEIKGEEGFWKLSELYDLEVDEKSLNKMKNAYRTQRKVSDV